MILIICPAVWWCHWNPLMYLTPTFCASRAAERQAAMAKKFRELLEKMSPERRERIRREAERLVAQYRCDEWNAQYPIGTTVEYHPVIGAPEHRIRTTRTQAEVLSGHTAVVWLNEESG